MEKPSVKLSSLLSALIFSLVGTGLAAQSNSVEFSFTGSNTVRSLANSFTYRMVPFRASQIQLRGLNTSEQRLNFAQKSRQALLNMDFILDSHSFKHSFLSGYEYLFDSSELEPEFHPYRNKTGFLGYSLSFLPADSLLLEAGLKGLIRSEDDRYLVGNTLSSEGWQATGKTSVGGTLGFADAGLAATYDFKDLDWESYQDLAFNAYLNSFGERLAVANQFNLGQRLDDLYVLESDSSAGGRGYYSLYDRQNRRSLLYSGTLDYSPLDLLRIILQESYSRRVIKLEQNTVRNNADYINLASLNLVFSPFEDVDWNTSANHSYAIKSFNFTQNTRHTEMRNLSTNLVWEYAFGDTLSTGMSLDLQRTSYPDDAHRWDNDTRNIRLNLGNVHYWHERVKLSSRVYWNLADDVYVNGILSDNNKRNSSLVLNPACAILIGDRLMFDQSYLIRADYTDYTYVPSNKAFYRQMELEYRLVFDSFPFSARSSDLRWILLPYRNKGTNAFRTDISFGYERNEYAGHDGSQYLINYKNTRLSAGLTLKHDIGNLYYIIQPQYTWGTWKEYKLLLGLAWKFTSNSLLEFSLNPSGESVSDLDWRTSVNLSAHF